jgi:RHH-type transcriptional regulator, proline utilization regulon repressor / proline dehydrogenase / delta 1-pyrroline-5-carboxylate dehydrogenase
MIAYPVLSDPSWREHMARLYRADEAALATELLAAAQLEPQQLRAAQTEATRWISALRAQKKIIPGAPEFLARFGLDSREGTALMCLAEALLRIPDNATADALIRDKFSGAAFDAQLGTDDGIMLRTASWSLALTGKIVSSPEDPAMRSHGTMLKLLQNRLSHSVIREALRHGMGWLGQHFVLGTDIKSALARAAKLGDAQNRFSFDMLGEAARTATDAERYFQDYLDAIRAIGAANRAHPKLAPSGLSVKLSALHPRYEAAQSLRVFNEMVPKLVTLMKAAATEDLFMVIDAEEADRLLLSLTVIERAMAAQPLPHWSGLGLAVQAYSKRAPAVIDFAAKLARHHRQKLIVRLIKGAYWDSEIKRAQERGWDEFPVFTRKQTTDVSYLACAKLLLSYEDCLTPVFGSHNAMTIASIRAIAPQPEALEFQRLQGMGEELFAELAGSGCRTCVYAPVGGHAVLLGYLVRRLLENGANSSFVHQLHDPRVPIESLVADPAAELQDLAQKRHPRVTLPQALFAPERLNSSGLDLTDPAITTPLLQTLNTALQREWQATPLINGKFITEKAAEPVLNPAQLRTKVGEVINSGTTDIADAVAAGLKAWPAWRDRPVAERAALLEAWAEQLQSEQPALLALLAAEAGKTINDAVGEVREAIDFCRYYAARARHDFTPIALPSVTGENNELSLTGRGLFVAISPWNFPLAIFVGQIAAALVTGNAVIAKPAPQTPLIGAFACRLAHAAGVPAAILQFVTGGAEIGAALVAHADIAGVVFTGSTQTARAVNRALAAKDGPIVPLIAETGGQNALIVDSSALPEQIIDDVITSAFRSAGQRCSALRLLCVPTATAELLLPLLQEALHELRLGDPLDLATDIGPVIDRQAQERLLQHVTRLRQNAKEIATLPIPQELAEACFVSPQAWEIPNVEFLREEVFGPILHVVRYKPEELPELLQAITATGYGLTGGVHSRISQFIEQVTAGLLVGNLYVNRSLIGAVVGSQPFGGMGLSGTGPKAGGPHYLHRFCHERCITINTTAAGGNASLLAAAGEKL